MISAPRTMADWDHRYAVVNGVRLHYVEAGSGPLVVLLHGFPEFWYSWRHQIPALAAAGFRVFAPDLRGYNWSDKPAGVPAYRLETLLEDVVGLIHQAGEEKAAIVGHDWGGVLAWHLAMLRPQVVDKLTVLNAPHPAAYWRELRSWEQMRKSWYVLFFQLPGLPEQVIGAGDYDAVDRMLRRKPVHAEAFTREDVHLYKQALSRPGALTAALNYYRALRYPKERKAQDIPPISAPTLLLWGEQDSYLSLRLTEGLGAWVPNLRVVRFPDASHFVQNDVPERVNRLLIDFLHGMPVPRVELSVPA
ncbi:MAG TPA: alpha/beta hydrolase [Gemmataceae bacterium]|nr:alpha/beta hydrolase [Gemmataceae bacterium]